MTFDTEFKIVINEMKAYLNKTNLNTIRFAYSDGWNFSMSIPRKKFEEQNLKTKGEWIE